MVFPPDIEMIVHKTFNDRQFSCHKFANIFVISIPNSIKHPLYTSGNNEQQ